MEGFLPPHRYKYWAVINFVFLYLSGIYVTPRRALPSGCRCKSERPWLDVMLKQLRFFYDGWFLRLLVLIKRSKNQTNQELSSWCAARCEICCVGFHRKQYDLQVVNSLASPDVYMIFQLMKPKFGHQKIFE